MSERVAWMHGEWVPESEAKVSIYDLGVAQAVGAFEMTRSFRGVTFKLREHLERLKQSCRFLGIPLNYTLDELELLCADCQHRNQPAMAEDDEHRLLIVASPGCAPIYRDLAGALTEPHVYIADFPLRFTVAGMSTLYDQGVHATFSSIRQVPTSSVPAIAKHRSRLHFHLAQQQAPAGTWPILLSENWVTELPGANLCARFGDTIVLANYECLPGISQQTVAELCQQEGWPVEWRMVDADELYQADEIWITGTPFFALSVVILEGKPIGNGGIGPAYKAMMEKADALVGLCIKDQIIKWDEEAGARSSTDARIHETLSGTKS
jgi:branched-chain amino acid aminotransferase